MGGGDPMLLNLEKLTVQESFMSEAADHSLTVNALVYSVN